MSELVGGGITMCKYRLLPICASLRLLINSEQPSDTRLYLG